MDFIACSCGCGGELHGYELAPDPAFILRPAGTPPGAVVDLATAKLHLRVSTTSEDPLITTYTLAAQLAVQAYCEASLIAQQWEALIGGIAGSQAPVVLPMGPVTSVDAVEAVPPTGPRVPLVGYSASGPVVLPPPEGWPAAPSAVAITYTAGPAEADPPVQMAVLLLVAQYYDHRATVHVGSGGAVTPLPYTVEYLLANYRAGCGLSAA